MPWTKDDVEKHKKGLTDKQKETWVKVANSALKRCLDKGGSQNKCEASAIRQANAVAGNQKGRDMDNILGKLQELWERFIEGVRREVEEVERKWDGSASNYESTEAYCKACLIDVNAAAGRDEKAQSHCMLPAKRPGSNSYDWEGIKAAAGGHGIGRVEKPDDVPEDAWNAAKKKAANTIISQYNKNDATAPDSVYKTAGKEPPERAIGTFRLHEQFYTLLRKEDEWPRVIDIYLDDGAMYGLVASQGKLYRYPLAVEGDDLQITGERQQVMEIHQPMAERAITVHRQADGRMRWMTSCCTAILNRVGEIDSTTLFDNMIRRTEESGKYPYLTFWHQGETFKMGQADWLARDGVVYLASGLFDEGELGEATAEGIEREPGYWGTSIKYLPIGEPEMAAIVPEISIPVYRDGEHVEISILPEHRAAAWFTSTGVGEEVMRMRDEVKEALRKLLGEERAEKWIGQTDDINRTAEEEGMISRAEGDQDALPAEGQQDDTLPAEERTIELDDEAVGAILRAMTESDEFAGVLKPLFEMVERLGEQVEALTKKLDEIGAASTEGMVKVRERLDALERDEEEKQREWLADLPRNRTTKVTYRPREANDPDNGGNGQTNVTYADVAASTLAKIPAYGKQ